MTEPREVFPCSGCSRRVTVHELCENGAFCWDCCGARHRDDPECAAWRGGRPSPLRGVPTPEFVSGYLAALDAVDRAIEDGEATTLNEVRGFITEDAERMAK